VTAFEVSRLEHTPLHLMWWW